MEKRISRKMEHVQHALATGQSGHQGFADIRFVHNSLPGVALADVRLDTRLGELALRSPIIINAMTGGAAETEAINRELAIAARECGLAMAVGSQMAALKDGGVAESYRVVRREHPRGVIFANLGSEATMEQAERAVAMLEANALQLHLNVVQELVMPEGDRDFTGMLERIARIAARIGVPVIAKEVGFGIMAESARLLQQAGVKLIDVGGAGGTNFAAIENARRERPLAWFDAWGNETAVALLETLSMLVAGDVIASGGIGDAPTIAKALALGAGAVGMAGALLRVQREAGTAALVAHVRQLEAELALILTALGARSVAELRRAPLVVGGDTAHWCAMRGIDVTRYARRGFVQG